MQWEECINTDRFDYGVFYSKFGYGLNTRPEFVYVALHIVRNMELFYFFLLRRESSMVEIADILQQ